MSTTYATTATNTYSTVDIENVVRNFRTDLRMMAESSGTRTREDVDNHAEDIGFFAKKKYIRYIDVTLLDDSEELKAARYLVNENSGEIEASRPGGVMWPKTVGGTLRIIVGWTAKYHSDPPDKSKLNFPWGPSSDDISHSSLTSSSGRSFTSNAYGFVRTDYSK